MEEKERRGGTIGCVGGGIDKVGEGRKVGSGEIGLVGGGGAWKYLIGGGGG